MTQFINVIKGSYRNAPIENTVFPLLAQPSNTPAKGWGAQVDGREIFGPQFGKVRVLLDDWEVTDDGARATAPAKPHVETDEEIMERIGQRFDILDQMTVGTIEGDVRAMIVVGPPGVGKSFGVLKQLNDSQPTMIARMRNNPDPYQVIKGTMSPIGLYKTLYEYSDLGKTLVFDDCDSMFTDELSLNILKAALDSSKKRTIFWNADSRSLRTEGVPNKFDYKGSVIFITNIKFDNVRSAKLRDHLSALVSRCHYLDLTMDTQRDKFLRIKQIARKGDLFVNHRQIVREREDEIIDFIEQNLNRLNEISLRMAVKIGDLMAMNPDNWRMFAENTCMRRK